MMKILIADDHDLIRVGLASVLEGALGYKVVGEVCDGLAAIAAVERLRPDVLILDNSMPRVGGIEVARQVAGMGAGCRMLMLSMAAEEACVRAAFRAGIRAYVHKENAQEEIFPALQALEFGRLYLSPHLGDCDSIARWLEEPDEVKAGGSVLELLTRRERTVFFAVVDGLTSKQIASELSISPRTVETHRENIKIKLGVPDLHDLLLLAAENGLVGRFKDAAAASRNYQAQSS